MSKISDLREERDGAVYDRDQMNAALCAVLDAIRIGHDNGHDGAFMWCPHPACVAAREDNTAEYS